MKYYQLHEMKMIEELLAVHPILGNFAFLYKRYQFLVNMFIKESEKPARNNLEIM